MYYYSSYSLVSMRARCSRLYSCKCIVYSGVRVVAGGLAVASCRGLEPLGTERLPVRGWGRHSLSVQRRTDDAVRQLLCASRAPQVG